MVLFTRHIQFPRGALKNIFVKTFAKTPGKHLSRSTWPPSEKGLSQLFSCNFFGEIFENIIVKETCKMLLLAGHVCSSLILDEILDDLEDDILEDETESPHVINNEVKVSDDNFFKDILDVHQRKLSIHPMLSGPQSVGKLLQKASN